MLKDNILDTLVFKNNRIYLKEFHLARTQEAFDFLNIRTNPGLNKLYDNIEKQLSDKISSKESLRIIFSTDQPGAYQFEINQIQPLGPAIKLNPVRIDTLKNPASQFKWQNRTFWNNLLSEKKSADADDILIINSENLLVETSRFNIFCYDEKVQKVFTPSLNCGCLNGVFRRWVLCYGKIHLPEIGNVTVAEKNIPESEIANYRLYVGNSVRGLLKAELIR